jgi:hypothetical protein
MDALTPAEIFSLRRAEQLVALDDLRTAQEARLAPPPIDLGIYRRQRRRVEPVVSLAAIDAYAGVVVETAR